MSTILNNTLHSELIHMGYTLCTSETPGNSVISGFSYVETKEMCSLLKGNELVLITGCTFHEESDFLMLLRTLKQKKCACILFTLGLFLNEIPVDALIYCNDAKIPLFSIPSEKFSYARIARITNYIYKSRSASAELSTALSQALSAPEAVSSYLPVFEKNHYTEDTPFCIGIVEPFCYNFDTKQKTFFSSKHADIQLFVESEYEDVIMCKYNNQFVFFFPNCEDYIARDIIMDIYHLVRSNNINEFIYLGTSEKFHHLSEISRGYFQANFVTMLKKKSAPKMPVVRFSSLSTYKLLAAIENRQILETYYKQHLEPLIEYDRIHKSSYFKLLEALIQCDFNITETASKLYLHRNSINYKINKIESILRCSLTSVAEKSHLLSAYKIWCILYKQECIPDRRHRNPAVALVSSVSGDDKDEISITSENCSL